MLSGALGVFSQRTPKVPKKLPLRHRQADALQGGPLVSVTADVVSIHDRAGRDPGDVHGSALGNPVADHVADCRPLAVVHRLVVRSCADCAPATGGSSAWPERAGRPVATPNP